MFLYFNEIFILILTLNVYNRHPICNPKIPKMEINEKIRLLREFNHYSQEEMVEKLNISTTGYAKIERGERGLNVAKLEKIASVFGMEVADLVSVNDKSVVYLINENSHHYNNNYGSEELAHEIDKLKLQLSHKDELLEQKNIEIKTLQKMIEILQNQVQVKE